MAKYKTRQQVVDDIQEANTALEITTYNSLLVETDAVWLYVDKNNGDDTTASSYLTTNTGEVHNQSSPFASYAGVDGAIEYATARITASDVRFVDKWIIIVDISEDVIWTDAVPSNSLGTASKSLLWCGFHFVDVVSFSVYDSFIHFSLKQTSFTTPKLYASDQDNTDHSPMFMFGEVLGGSVQNYGHDTELCVGIYKTVYDAYHLGRSISDAKRYNVVNSVCRFVGATYNSIQAGNLYAFKFSRLINSIIIEADSQSQGNRAFEDINVFRNCIINSTFGTTVITSYDTSGTCLFDTDPLFVDEDGGIMYVKPNSPAIKSGENGADIGIGVGFYNRNADLNYLLPELLNGTRRNLGHDSNGKLFVEYTGLQVVSATSTTVTFTQLVTDVDEYFTGLKLRTYQVDGTLIDEVEITAYDGTTRTATVGTAFTTTPDVSYTVDVSASIESTVMNYDMLIDKLIVTEQRRYGNTGKLERGVGKVWLKTSNVINGGRIPESGDTDYNATLHEYKEHYQDYVRIDANGYGSANASFDPTTATKISAVFEQIKIDLW